MKRIIFLLAVTAIGVCFAAPVSAALYVGTLSKPVGDGLMVTGGRLDIGYLVLASFR